MVTVPDTVAPLAGAVRLTSGSLSVSESAVPAASFEGLLYIAGRILGGYPVVVGSQERGQHRCMSVAVV